VTRNPMRDAMYLVALAIGSLMFPQNSIAEVPRLIHYQGQVLDSQEIPLEGPYTLTFRLYDAEIGGTTLWEEVQTDVPIHQGHFSVSLGEVNTLEAIVWDQPCWLSVQINSEPELLPRQRITSVPLAVRASVAEQLATPITTLSITDDAHRLVPIGAIILWMENECPSGYSRLSALDGKFITAGPDYNAEAGGSNTHTHSIPPHAHNFSATTSGASGPSHGWNAGRGSSSDASDAPELRHTHSISGSTNSDGSGTTDIADSRPEFATMLLCQKD